MSKTNIVKWNHIQKELNSLYADYDLRKISDSEYWEKLIVLRDRQDEIRDK